MATGTAPNAQRLLWAGFFAIFAAGVGFGVRGSILVDWANQYGFTQAELGEIGGYGLWGFGVIIIIGSLVADTVGYGKLMILAFLLHVASALLQMSTGWIYDNYGGREGVYSALSLAMFLFAVGNGICEVVVNPMVATLFPKEKTHYLNILHAGWPGGLITGGLIGYVLGDQLKVSWMVQMSLFLVPVLIYGFLLLGQQIPRSEAGERGVSFGTMLMEFAAPMFILLLVIHAMVGYVELGTDSWISKITGSVFESRGAGMLLFVYTSGLMFVLRFFAGPIEKAINPIGLLLLSAVLAAIGLTMLGNLGGMMLIGAATVYGIGKTFFWPTMLAVVSERFPRGGALTLGMVGGIGMLSAGFLGSPGIGFKQDYYASEELKTEHAATYARYAVAEPKSFLFVFSTKGLDGAKVGLLELAHDVKHANDEIKKLETKDPAAAKEMEKSRDGAVKELDKTLTKYKTSTNKSQQDLAKWWEANEVFAAADYQPIRDASLHGGQTALRLTAIIPAAMAVLYLGLLLYFVSQGGYKPAEIHPGDHPVPAQEAPGSEL